MTQDHHEARAEGATEFASSEEAVAAILELIDGARRILICGHVRADGDCVGSMAAMFEYLRARGKDVRLFFRGSLQEVFLAFLPEGQKPGGEFPGDYDPDLTLCLDTAGADRVIEGFEELAQGTVVNIDHHPDNTRYGHHNWIGPHYASVGEMLYDLFEADPEAWSAAVARGLYLAVMSDTGGFRFGNTTARSLEKAARLVERGADPAAIASAVWGSRRIESVRIAAGVLGAMRFELDGRLVWSEATQELLRANGGEANEPDGLSGELRGIRGVEVALLLRETAQNTARASLRSSGRVDVNTIAAKLGGGGHRAAAGLELREPYAQARQRILDTVIEEVRKQLSEGSRAEDSSRDPKS